jgi:S-adenosylmethionine hydrolase
MSAIVTLLSDFGTADGFVGAMKGVVLSRAPLARIVDLTHDIAPHDVRAGAWALREAAATFPQGTIHVAVVDPGVGTERRAILLLSCGQLYLGPDNGLLSLAAPQGQGWVLDRPELFCRGVSSTFHGRDIFASVAGHLAAGVAPEACGTPIATWARLERPVATLSENEVQGEVVHVDRFGNLVTNIICAELDSVDGWEVHLDDRPLGAIRTTFGDVDRGRWVAYTGSSGALEIAVREGRAGDQPGSDRARVTLCRTRK